VFPDPDCAVTHVIGGAIFTLAWRISRAHDDHVVTPSCFRSQTHDAGIPLEGVGGLHVDEAGARPARHHLRLILCLRTS
jgi:hypothetical protein